MRAKRLYYLSSKSHLIILLCFLFFLDGFILWLAAKLDYERTYERAQIVLQKTAISSEERMRRTFAASDAILQNLAERIQERGVEATASSREEWERFRNAARELPDAGSLWLLDGKADLLMDSTEYPSQKANFSERDYFAPQRDKGIETYIGPVVKGKITGKYSFTISRRIGGKDGSFLGVVVAAIETDDFANFLRNIDIGSKGAVSVFRTDGALILRQPLADRHVGKTYEHLKLFSIPLDQSPSGIYETDEGLDGVRRLIAYQKISGLPLVAATSIPTDSIAREWRGRFRIYSVIAIIVLFALVGLSWLVHRRTAGEEIAQRELQKLLTDLEQRVAERTKELSETNRSLQAEIVERERAQVALQESERRWATTLESIGDAVIATDMTGAITFMNAIAEQLTGWTLAEAVSKPVTSVFNIVSERTRVQVENPVTKAIRDGAIVGLANHTLLIRKDGTEIPVDDSGAPIRSKDGGATGVVLVFRDIIERKKAEAEREQLLAELSVERSRWQATVENMLDPVTVCDAEGRATYMNRAYEQLVEKTIAEGLRIEDHPDYYELFRPDGTTFPADELPLQRAARMDQEIRNVEIVQRSTSGHDLTLVFSAAPLHNTEGQVVGAVAVGRDITEQRRAEQALKHTLDELGVRVQERTAELQEAYDRLKRETAERERAEVQLRQAQKLEALGTLAGGIAHDFNNILAAIIGFSEMARDKMPTDTKAQHHLKRVLEAGIRGRELVKQMLTFSKQKEQEKKPVLVSNVVKETVAFLRASIPATISMDVTVKSESGPVFADPVQMQQVIMNLCTNAAFAMRERGGRLGIELRDFSASGSGDDPRGIKAGTYLELMVRDAGDGIPPEIINRIFDPFFTTKKPGDGTGLGLSVVHGIVVQHEGYIFVESEPGVGSTFAVYFPMTVEEVSAQPAQEEAKQVGRERVLFVDDEEALAELGQELLEELGYTVTAKRNSLEALAAIKANPDAFDLVVTDQTMPDLTGLDLATQILLVRPDMPVILCTGYDHLVDQESLKMAGIKALATKPLTKAEIAKTIRMVLDE